MTTFITIYLFIVGLVLGSFYNVVGLRVPEKKFFSSARSQCPTCGNTLTWRELVPVFSYLGQKGKCRHCKTKISPIYPITELATGLLFAYSFINIGFSLELVVALVLISLLMIIFVSDLSYMLIPDGILLFFLPIFIILRFFVPLNPWWDPIAGSVAGYLLLAIIILISKGGMGGGDMKLFAVLGIVLGFRDMIVAFFLSTFYGAIISGLLLAFGLVKRKQPIPFGPFIILGTVTAYFFADNIVEWYIDTFF